MNYDWRMTPQKKHADTKAGAYLRCRFYDHFYNL